MGEENVCRLCLNLVKNEFKVINETTRKMLKILFLEVDLDASRNPIVCLNCAGIIEKSYLFKMICINTEECIHSYNATKEIAKFDIKDVYDDSRNMKTIANEGLNICRFCMKQTERSSCVSIDILMNDAMYVEMLPIFLPNMVLNIIQDPVICASCKEILECYFNFTKTCLDTEQKINKYCQSEGIFSTSRIKLNNVLGFLFQNASTYPEIDTQIQSMIKQESLLENIEQDDVEVRYEQVKCEEEFDIKDEDVTSFKNLPEILIDDSKLDKEIETVQLKYDTKQGDTTNKKCIKSHMITHKKPSEVKMHKCDKCTYESKFKYYLTSHMLKHKDAADITMHKCGICSYETRYKRTFRTHLLKHKDTSQVEMYKCRLCTYETRYKNNIKYHMLIHKATTEVEMYKCEMCTYETKFKSDLNKHVRKHKDISEVVMYKCDKCTYESKFRYYLTRHMLKHKDASDIRMHKCEICSYETRYERTFRTHHLKHKNSSEVEMYKCQLCTFETRYKNNIKYHMIIHKATSEVEMYKCGTCTYETKFKNDLKRHMRMHKDVSEVEMYKCGICKFETKYKNALKMHIVKHTRSS